MFRKMVPVAIFMGVLTFFNSIGHAAHDHNTRYRALDDLAFDALIHARELRWELHDNFIESRDYAHLQADADRVVSAIHDLQRSIYQERSDRSIATEIATTRRQLANLLTHLNDCDYARVRDHRIEPAFRGRGYSFRPESQHAGRVHVIRVRKMIAGIEASMDQLERLVSTVNHHPRSPNVRPELPQPGPALVPRNTNLHDRRSFEIPVGNSARSGLVLRFNF